MHPSTTSRELKRNKDSFRGYNAEIAQVISAKKHKQKAKRFSLTKSIEKYIRTKLKEDWSLDKYLRHKNKKYHCRTKDYMARGMLIDRIMIDKRPKIVDKKSRIGDLEIDTVVGKDHKGFLVTVVDRKSKLTLIKNVPTK